MIYSIYEENYYIIWAPWTARNVVYDNSNKSNIIQNSVALSNRLFLKAPWIQVRKSQVSKIIQTGR